MKKALFGAGCFWGVEAAFRELPGVIEVTSGYAGGAMPQPTYGDVCTGETGHAEVVEVHYEPEQVTYEQLLEKFWDIHDPTQRDRQGPDVGTQYRSAIFFSDPEQEAAARASLQRQQQVTRRPIVTEIAPTSAFYAAEDYHQRYFERRGLAGFRH